MGMMLQRLAGCPLGLVVTKQLDEKPNEFRRQSNILRSERDGVTKCLNGGIVGLSHGSVLSCGFFERSEIALAPSPKAGGCGTSASPTISWFARIEIMAPIAATVGTAPARNKRSGIISPARVRSNCSKGSYIGASADGVCEGVGRNRARHVKRLPRGKPRYRSMKAGRRSLQSLISEDLSWLT